MTLEQLAQQRIDAGLDPETTKLNGVPIGEIVKSGKSTTKTNKTADTVEEENNITEGENEQSNTSETKAVKEPGTKSKRSRSTKASE